MIGTVKLSLLPCTGICDTGYRLSDVVTPHARMPAALIIGTVAGFGLQATVLIRVSLSILISVFGIDSLLLGTRLVVIMRG